MAESFTERWKRRERECGFAANPAKMICYGPDVLPDLAAPFLRFEDAARRLPIWQVFGSQSDWSESDRKRLAAYKVIGSDGAGNPICVELNTGTVVMLDHEDRFHTVTFVNTSVRQLGECLLAYMGERDSRQFRSAVKDIDPPAIQDGSFWWHEAMSVGNA